MQEGIPAFVGILTRCDLGGACCSLLFCGDQQVLGELLHVASFLFLCSYGAVTYASGGCHVDSVHVTSALHSICVVGSH